MSSGDTNDSVYIQKLFTSRDNFTQGNVQEAQANAASYVGQEGRSGGTLFPMRSTTATAPHPAG